VITLDMGAADLPANVVVQSMGKERGWGRARELVAFYRALGQAVRDVDVIFSHMVPRYTWLAAPLALLCRKPQMLWYAHRQSNRELRMALACARWITTSTQDTFPIPSPKVHVMGQGIDTLRFSPGEPPHDDPPLVLAVGRLSPIKYHHTLLEAAALLRDQHGSPPVRFAVAGAVAAPGDEAYLDSLLKRRAELDFSAEQFAFLGGKTQDDLVTLYRRASVATNLSPVGLFDKAALEAMLAGTPLIAANPAFDGLLGDHRAALRVGGPDDAAGVAARLAGLLALPAEERDAIGRDLRARTAEAHGLDRLMARLVALMQEGN
jgi:glycosyltransferase involved in cell wall biosynthesis